MGVQCTQPIFSGRRGLLVADVYVSQCSCLRHQCADAILKQWQDCFMNSNCIIVMLLLSDRVMRHYHTTLTFFAPAWTIFIHKTEEDIFQDRNILRQFY